MLPRGPVVGDERHVARAVAQIDYAQLITKENAKVLFRRTVVLIRSISVRVAAALVRAINEDSDMPGKNILMLCGEFTEEYEIFVFQQAMEALGHTVHVVCPDKRAGEVIATSLHDFEGHQTYTEKPGHNALINKTFAEIRPDEYHAVYAAGGRGPEYIRTDKRVQALVRHFHEARKPIFTICHGVQILVAVDGVVRGKKVAALGACEPEVTLAGGTYVDLSPTEALVDGTMVSAKGWTALAAFIRECLKVLGTEIRHSD